MPSGIIGGVLPRMGLASARSTLSQKPTVPAAPKKAAARKLPPAEIIFVHCFAPSHFIFCLIRVICKIGASTNAARDGLTTKLTRRRKRRLGARHERKAEAIGGRVQRLVRLRLVTLAHA